MERTARSPAVNTAVIKTVVYSMEHAFMVVQKAFMAKNATKVKISII